ncbi:beta-1,2-xylosyltransferase-like [Rhodamnia argentea]|uniref:Beta-1,2-xylosyltransferase-like n=1 Tax=Rhodamnia argentea TaxID=178133 RepID=A0A8B8Q2X5_9MYRT|nr:beta-1,2-xylosyltransferase-like [Rhodamnia argentea]
MTGRSYNLLKVVVALFAINTLSLFLYFRPTPKRTLEASSSQIRHDDPTGVIPQLTERRRDGNFDSLKRWPILPSYLPWSQNPSARPHSCEAFFGNGFTRRLDLLSAVDGGGGRGGGWFRCFHSETLESSVCEGGQLRMSPERIRMAVGGERLEDVLGRSEEEEMPVFEDGAFQISEGGGGGELVFRRGKSLVSDEFLDNYVDQGKRHPIRSLIGSIRVVKPGELQCDQWIEEPTLLITRFEYANLFHTVTDWYNAYVSSRVTELPYRPHVIFVDGHCTSPMEEMWQALFSSVAYAKSFHGSVCFRRAVMSPLGYENAMFKGLSQPINCQGTSAQDLWRNPDDHKTARLSEFGEMIRSAFGFSVNRHHPEKAVSGHNVLFVRRENYLAHPRHSGKPESRLSNEQEVFDSLKSWASNHIKCKVNLVNGLFAHMLMKDQVQAIQDASVIIGAHGAGLTHIVSATPKTVILEIISSQYRRPHFALISKWKGLEYHAINLVGSHADPPVVINELSSILKSLGC